MVKAGHLRTQTVISEQIPQLLEGLVSGGTQRGRGWGAPEQCRWKEKAPGDPSAVTRRGFGRSREPVIFNLSLTPTVLLRWEEQGLQGRNSQRGVAQYSARDRKRTVRTRNEGWKRPEEGERRVPLPVMGGTSDGVVSARFSN